MAPRPSRPSRLSRQHYRKPPRPLRWNVPKGNCRFCSGEIIEQGKINRRKHWHTDTCLRIWLIMNQPSEARKFVFLRSKGTCAHCDFFRPRMKDFECDHIQPLFEAHGDRQYWEPDNLQNLCLDCHKAKTKIDSARAREQKKIQIHSK